MKKTGILNSKIVALIGRIGHGNKILICDAGFPHANYPKIELIDLAVVAHHPGLIEVFDAIRDEMVIQQLILPKGMGENNRALFELVVARYQGSDETNEVDEVDNDDFKRDMMDGVMAIIRTGECTPFGNAMLVAGTSY